MLASAGDDGNILLWVPSENHTPALGEDDIEDKETWRVRHMCRSSTGAEIYDLAWSPDGVFFITGGVDNTARIYNASNGEYVKSNWYSEAKFERSIDQADCRAQSLRSGRSLGSSKRICCDSVFGQIRTYLFSEIKRRNLHPVRKIQQNGPTRQTDILQQSGPS